MLTPAEIREKAERKYPAFLRAIVSGETFFPLHIRFGIPATTEEFAKLQVEVTALARENFGYTIEWETKNTRRHGTQRLPTEVRFDTEEQFVAALKKQAEVKLFRANIAESITRIPEAKSWFESHVKWVTEYGAIWPDILLVCEYFRANPRPNLYARELPIRVHTKFVQENVQVLGSLLAAILPADAIQAGDTFEARFGLKALQPLVRIRFLDPVLQQQLASPQAELGLPLNEFEALALRGIRILITENLMNFVCLLPAPNTLAIFGQGNAAELLLRVSWLQNCDAYYWGDMDEHGYHILGRLRAKFPGMRSLNMDYESFLRNKHLAGAGQPAGRAPSNLTDSERQAYGEIQAGNLRIEQEKIPNNLSSM